MRRGVFYDVSDYDIRENGEIVNKHNGHVVKPQVNGKRYLRVSIGKKLQFVHRLVAEQYVPNPENKPQVNHIDGNKFNNAASNLEWVTNQENRDHAVKNNLIVKGEDSPLSKITQADVDYIREHTEFNSTELAHQFNLSPSHIRSIRRGVSWKN